MEGWCACGRDEVLYMGIFGCMYVWWEMQEMDGREGEVYGLLCCAVLCCL